MKHTFILSTNGSFLYCSRCGHSELYLDTLGTDGLVCTKGEEFYEPPLEQVLKLEEDWDKAVIDGREQEIGLTSAGIFLIHNYVPEPKPAPVLKRYPILKVNPHSMLAKELVKK